VRKSAFTPAYEALKARLVAMRRAAGLTQRQLARRLKREPSFVARIEQGERRLDVIEFYWVCEACGANPEKVAPGLMRVIRSIERAERQRGRRG
jgi:transcriptional regulator with XRE-family HTH domain